MRSFRVAVSLALSLWVTLLNAQFNNPDGVDIWCGKAYRETNFSFNPGGGFEEPPTSSVPLLNLRVRPRISIYLDTDQTASLLIDSEISYQVGQPLATALISSRSGENDVLEVQISLDGTFVGTASVKLNSTNVEIPLNLENFPATLSPYTINILAKLGNNTYTSSAEFLRLPSPEGYGSVARIDNLYGGLWVQRDQEKWKHIFPYTYYVQWTLYWDSNVTTLDEFASMGYNVIHIVPTGTLGDQPFPWDQFEPYLDRADELGLYLQYNVIWDWQNLTGMISQVERLRSHRSMLLWYQSDEPDGKSNPINSTGIAYQKIRSLDPYHPVSLALNCYDFYYADYAAGADIILTDTYPIAINATFSTVYDTVCNATYGCCGCDDCVGTFEDISDRIDEFHRRDELIGWPKVQWYAPQAFGNETFWSRYPTADEEAVVTMLAVNHGAKGIVMWDYPTTAELANLTSHLAAVLTTDAIAAFLLEAPLTQTLDIQGADRIDAAAWFDAGSKQLLLSVVNLNYEDVSQAVIVSSPAGVRISGVAETFWGNAALVTHDIGVFLPDGVRGLGVVIVVLDTY